MTRFSIATALTLLSGALSVVSASGAVQHGTKRYLKARSVTPDYPPPSQDPWYTAPPGFENAKPGDVLRTREAKSYAQVMGNCSTAHSILYRTTDSNQQPSWAVTTLFIPTTLGANASVRARQDVERPLLSYQYYYDSANVDASPSYDYWNDTDPATIPLISATLGFGWYVSSPDYEGPLASFILGTQAGQATLDSIRAVLRSGLAPQLKDKYALWGYSGGSLASEWAAELAESYAPELKIAGAALGGLTPNGHNVAPTVNKGKYAALIPQGAVGITSQNKTARDYLLGELIPEGPFNASTFMSVANIGTPEAYEIFAGQDIYQYFKDGEAVLQSPILGDLIDREAMQGTHGVPKFPLFAYKPINDEFSPVQDTDALINQFCGQGANILYQRNSVGEHLSEIINGAPRAVEFLASLFDGSYPQKYNATGCTIQNVTIGEPLPGI